MNASTSPSETELLEQLSAYLDGELDPQAAQQVEQLLAADARARDVLQQLEQASAVLDDLPRRDVQPSFTTTTISMIALSEADVLAQQGPAGRRGAWARWLLRTGGLVVALATG
ncbi:MAG TPA: zf-HC2 domain-containing protein, partial [Pirellulales bacterium]|nr:zf-HC2 domain-containing protein [Pirellulales bacterium]